MMTESTTKQEVIGRNEPCPCKSGKKYKRCCGVNAAPKLSTPSQQVGFPGAGNPAEGTGATHAGAGFDPAALAGQLDPQMMMQFTQALQRLPKGQLQRLQGIMQKAMNGRDVSAEAAELERSLPVDFQNLIHSFKMPMMNGLGSGQEAAPMTETETSAMTEEQARALVAQAAAEGAISKEQAELLLKSEKANANAETPAETSGGTPESTESPESKDAQKDTKIGKFWRNIAGKKS